jgi:diamine N-acetyltransferase
MSVEFRKITRENFYPLLKLDPGDEGKFVASNAVSLAEAWLHYEAHDTHPFAIYHREELVGFLMVHEDLSKGVLDLWRLAIAKEHQGKGYGAAALKKLIFLAGESGKYTCIAIGYMEGNDRARHIYEKLGFRPTGVVEDGEIILRLGL